MIPVIAIVFGVGVVSLLIYGIVTHRTRPMYEDAGILSKLRFHPKWVPLTMIVDPSLEGLEGHIMEALKEAASWWEFETGFQYFAPPGELVDGGHVIPIMEDTEDLERAERAFAYVDFGEDPSTRFVTSAAIFFLVSYRGHSHEHLVGILKHELGHCLGLAHDGDERSIMGKYMGHTGQIVSKQDRLTLHQLYPYAKKVSV